MESEALTKKIITAKLPIPFTMGDPNMIKLFLINQEDEFHPYYGKEKFYRNVLALYPDYPSKVLQPEYNNAIRMIRSAINFCHEYNYYLTERKDYQKEWGMKFVFWESCEPELIPIEFEYKKLDGLILPMDHPFWDRYLPPNFFGDYCTVRYVIHDAEYSETPIELPVISPTFNYSVKDIFFYRSL